jgi:hypothetical protein
MALVRERKGAGPRAQGHRLRRRAAGDRPGQARQEGHPREPGVDTDRRPRQRRAEGALPAGAVQRPQARCLRPDRALGRLQRGRPEDARRARRRALPHHRLQGLHHQRRGGRRLSRHRAQRKRRLGLHPRPRPAGLRHRPARPQDGHARLADLDAVLRRRARAAQPDAGRRRARLQGLRPRAGPRPRQRRGADRRPGAGGLRRGRRLRAAARAVRPPGGRLPGRAVPDRRHGHRPGGRAPADAERGAHVRRRHADQARVVDGQALRRRGRAAHLRHRHRAARRLRLPRRLRGRAHLPRRQVLPHGRRHEPDPAHRDRARELLGRYPM